MATGTKKNLITYLIFLLICLSGIYYARIFLSDTVNLRIWEISNVLILLAGVVFLFFQRYARLPDFWQNDIPGRQRFLYPILIGITFGILDVIIFKLILHPQPYSEMPPFTQPFPYSIFLYFSGAFEIEVFYRLIPLTLILLAGSYVRGGKSWSTFFWFGAVLTAIREPLEQMPQGGFLLITYSLLTGFLMNFLQAVWYRKAGFLASLSLRLGHYLIWHILLGIYIEYYEI